MTDMTTSSIRVRLPYPLQVLAHCEPEITLRVPEPLCTASVISALESRYPMLRGTIIDHNDGRRRPMVRFFADCEDWSFENPDRPLPDVIRQGREPFIILGAISGG